MNDYRLTTSKIKNQLISKDELNLINSTPAIFKHMDDGRIINNITGLEDYSIFSTIFIIIDSNNNEILVKTLKEAAEIIGIHSTTLSKKLNNSQNDLHIQNFKIKRVRVYFAKELNN